ncbi:MAG: rhomboid family intramembrane serine protease [Anaerolineales bacterium]|nr:rhomboid family intramembrane serine protease [Anaerolineales bacterium]
MLPLKDLNPTRRVPFITYALIAVNVIVFLWTQFQTTAEVEDIFIQFSVVPINIAEDPLALETFLDILRSMFFHGGWLHLLGNMLYLWLFGDNVEDRMGAVLYLILYLYAGAVAAIAQVLMYPNSNIPLVGASGAIAGILGSYLLLFPGVRVRGIVPIGPILRFAEWPAWTVLGLWFVLQLIYVGLSILGGAEAGGGVAFFAHIGGFIAGLVFTWIFMRLVPQPPPRERREVLYERAQRYRY